MREAIADVMARFAAGLDSCDWSLYRSAFADEIDLDYSSWRPTSIGRWSADDWVARAARLFPGLSASRHSITNLLVIDEGNGATIRANVCADHVIVDGDRTDAFTLNGVYHDRLVMSDNGWVIAGKRLVVEWCVGDRALLDRAADDVARGHLRRG